MTVKNLMVGNKYLVISPEAGKTFEMYFLEKVTNYDHVCDCCGKDTISAYVFCEKFYKDDYDKSWYSGTWFVGGTACLVKYVSEIIK